MTVPLHLLEKIARHGAAAQRLIDERKRGVGEHSEKDDDGAIAFDTADFDVTFLALCGDESVLETRELRNNVAQHISTAIREHNARQESEERGAVFENDGSPLGPGEYDGMRYVLEEEDGNYSSKSLIEAYVRDSGYEKFLSVHIPASLREPFAMCLQKGEFNPSWFNSSLTLELSVQADWITDGRQRAAARRRIENLHIRVPLDAIKVSYGEEGLSGAELG
jgi:hypothetical protein